MLTNIVLVIPTLAVLLIIAAYLEVRGILVEPSYRLHGTFQPGPSGADLFAGQSRFRRSGALSGRK